VGVWGAQDAPTWSTYRRKYLSDMVGTRGGGVDVCRSGRHRLRVAHPLGGWFGPTQRFLSLFLYFFSFFFVFFRFFFFTFIKRWNIFKSKVLINFFLKIHYFVLNIFKIRTFLQSFDSNLEHFRLWTNIKFKYLLIWIILKFEQFWKLYIF
jgi:hypothetical protein